jgi:DNA (cytosine-5)-methyltransferase 1
VCKPKALDLFCCAGGAGMGLHQAGFDVVGVDIKPQSRYPFEFHQADALAYPLDGFDFIWASPPCQKYSVTAALHPSREHPDLIDPVRARLAAHGTPYVIENVVGAPLFNPIMLCGTMFGLRVYRHRMFEASFFLSALPHGKHVQGSTGSHRGYSRGNPMVCVAGHNFKREEAEQAMGIDWMSSREQLSQAIPPAYSEYIGRAALAHIAASASIAVAA